MAFLYVLILGFLMRHHNPSERCRVVGVTPDNKVVATDWSTCPTAEKIGDSLDVPDLMYWVDKETWEKGKWSDPDIVDGPIYIPEPINKDWNKI